jgi:neurotransmitter:Na+ symporter, NSS family
VSTDSWTGRAGFLLATIGSAVGIGSIWKFPYELGANGGSAFLLFYLLGLVAVVVPLMFAEFAIGRAGRGDAVASVAALARRVGADPHWGVVGGFGVLTGFLILTFYSVVGGWTIGYALDTALHGLPAPVAAAVQARYSTFLADPWAMSAYQAMFIAATGWVVGRGVVRGIETASKVLMPLLAALMVVLLAYSMVTGDVGATVRFLLTLDADRFTARTAIEALGLGFFSIGVGLGLMITFAAYAGAEISLSEVAVVSVLADTTISLMAGFAVFPIVFAHGLDPSSGPGLVFVTLPLAFARMPLGTVAATAFFLLLAVAALASAISMLELVVALLSRWRGWSRARATAIAASACFACGIPTVLSFNVAADWHPLAVIPALANATFYDLIDELTSTVMLPLGAFALALFAGWVLPAHELGDELRMSPRALALYRLLLRWLVPAGIAAATLYPLLARDGR